MGKVQQAFRWYAGAEPSGPSTSSKKQYFALAECDVELRATAFPDNPLNLIRYLQDFVLLKSFGVQKLNVLFGNANNRDFYLLTKLTCPKSLFKFAVSLRPNVSSSF
ncbi:hypothetical protein HDU76_004885 [Blyttiomyces sp. JEL0837]|nr:hypothetical protein HDU76_004885 [Blyttiomyces sp. JEL0837]